MVWRALVHSAIGTRHQQRQLPCQDYGDYLIQDSIIMGAVADGAGSAQHSEVGAQLAVQTALNSLKNWVNEAEFPAISELESVAPERFHQIVQDVVAALEQQAQTGGYSLQALGCTLLTFVATPQWIAAMQIGDGFIVVQTAESDTYELLFAPSKGEFINETVFVTTPSALEYLQCKVLVGEPTFVCAATDGLEKVAIRFHDWYPYPPFFNPFKACLETIEEPVERQGYLETFLNSERLNSRTDDDKTLLVCTHSMADVAEAAEP